MFTLLVKNSQLKFQILNIDFLKSYLFYTKEQDLNLCLSIFGFVVTYSWVPTL